MTLKYVVSMLNLAVQEVAVAYANGRMAFKIVVFLGIKYIRN